MSIENPVVLTRQGYEKIEKELDRLRTVDRRQVAERIRESKQFGEVTENAEYEDAKTEQAFVEGRIQNLYRILQIARILDPEEIPTDHVGIGSVVTVRDLGTDDDWELTLVSSVESDPDNDRISDESPVGQALLGHGIGDRVSVRIPDGIIEYEIVAIRK